MANVVDKSWIGLAHDIRNVASGGRSVDDNKFSLRQIMFWIRMCYAELLESELEKKKLGLLGFRIDESLINDLGCVPLTEVDKSECGCYKTGCVVLRTPKLPKFMSLLGKLQITYVGGIDKQNPFVMTSAENVNTQISSRFGANLIYWYWKNDYIYVVTPAIESILSCINVQGITSDFTAVVPQCGSDGTITTPCFDIWSTEVNIADKYIHRISLEILKNKMGVMLAIPSDEVNDGAHSEMANRKG